MVRTRIRSQREKEHKGLSDLITQSDSLIDDRRQDIAVVYKGRNETTIIYIAISEGALEKIEK